MATKGYSRRDVLRGLGGLALAPALRAAPRSSQTACPTSSIAAVANRARTVAGLEAYAQKSVAAGETVDFRISSPFPGTHQLSLVRLGWDTELRTKDWTVSTVALPAPGPQPIHPGSYVHVESALDSSAFLTALTLECWVRPFRGPGHFAVQGILAQYTDPGPCGFALMIDATGRPAAYFGNGGPFDPAWRRTGPSPLAPLAWHHLAATFDAGTVSLYVDGVQVDHATLPGISGCTPGEAPLRIGALGDATGTCSFLDGDVAMPVIYGRALTPVQVASRAQRSSPPRVPRDHSMMGCWPLDEEKGSMVVDASRCQRTGLVVNHGTWMIGGPSFDADAIQEPYHPDADLLRGHALRLSGSDLYDCGWPVTHSMTVPADLAPGVYVGRIQYGSGSRFDVPFVVRRAANRPHAPIVVLCATNTWLAYNKPFDLSGFYDDHAASQPTYHQGFEMPWSNPDPYGRFRSDADPYLTYSTTPGYSHLVRAERFLHVWLEQNGYDYDVISDRDLHTTPDILAPYQVLFIAGHSEYWTHEAQTSVRDYVAAGGHLIAASGNTMFWRVSMDDRVLECRKPSGAAGGFHNAKPGELYHEHDHARGGLMRDAGYPAWMATGLECNGYDGAHVPFEVTDSTHAFFQAPEAIDVTPPGGGPLVQIGGPVGVGHEWDTSLPEIPGHNLTGPALNVLAQALGNGSEIRFDYHLVPIQSLGAVISEIVEWSSGAGRVFAVGSIAAAQSLHADTKMAALFRNVLHAFGVRFRLHAMALAQDGHLAETDSDGELWNPLGEDATPGFGAHPPAGVQWGPDRLASLAISSVGALLIRFFTGGAWSSWIDLSSGNLFQGRVAAVGWSRNRLAVWARDMNGHVLHRTWSGGAFGSWIDLGGPFASDPAVATWEGDHFSAAALDAPGNVRYRELANGVWGPRWRDMGGRFGYAPTLFAWGGNRLSVFAVDASGKLWVKTRTASIWSPSFTDWHDLGAPSSGLAGRVHAAITGHDQTTGRDTFSVFGIGADGRLKAKWWSGTEWGPSITTWTDLGGSLVGEPAVVSYRGGRLAIFAVGSDAQLWRLDWNGTAWSAWQPMGGSLVGSPGAFGWVAAG